MTTKRTERDACERGDLLVTVLYGEATKAERAEFEAHKSACAVCAEEFVAFGDVRESLQGWEVERMPEIRVEIRPSLWERVRQAFVILPPAARWVAVGACAMLMLAVVNTDLSVGPNGVSFRTGLVPRTVVEPQVAGGPTAVTSTDAGRQLTVSPEELDRLIAERTDAVVKMQLASYREELDVELKSLQVQLVSAQSVGDVQKLSKQVAAQRRKIDELQKDIDRTAGYGGSDLFSAVLSTPEPGT